MAQDVFVDASFWIAFVYPLDEHSGHARTVWRDIVREKSPVATTNWTLYEALTWLSCRLQRHDLAVQALDIVSQLSEIIHIEEAQLESRSLEIFRSHTDKQWSVVDCASFACIEQRQCEYALSYDHNFEQAQREFKFRLLGF
jgi:predicted nucleic acid-binding protein